MSTTVEPDLKYIEPKSESGQEESEESQPPPAQPEANPPDQTQNKWLVSIAVMFGVLMSAIDSSVVNVALPNIQGSVGATQQEITWISTSYLISVVILMPLTNWLSLRFGRKTVYLTSLVVFTASSFMCGVANSLDGLIFWRVIQGLGAGTLQPLAQAMFRESFPRNEQGVAMGLFGLVVLFGPAIGPTLGGYITDNYEWPWIFFINIPIGIIGFIVAMRVLKDPPYMHGGSHTRVDATGITLMAIGLASLQTVLEQGQLDDWFQSTFICAFTAISVVTLVGWVVWELTFDKPAVDLRILKDVTFSTGSFIGGTLGLGLFASLFLLPQFMQTLLGFSATQSGLSLMPRSITMMVMMPISGLLYNRLGPKIMIATGLALSVYAQWIMGHFDLTTGYVDFLPPQIIQGIGFGLVFVSLSTAALSNMPREQLTSGAGLYNLIRQLGGSFGTAAIVTILTRHTQDARVSILNYINLDSQSVTERVNAMAGSFVAHGYSYAVAHRMALGALEELVERQSAMIAYDYTFLAIGLLFLICIPAVFLLRVPAYQPDQKVAAAAE